ncbi:arylamine N-acetyltransferase [Actinosynnema sp. NPDC020468]|uniref:arylamine N-acetyltransferase family protein n=1 Tax=Actinosynnema sp. NPDC020468 TaxID=3154488 RepID=UPI0033C4AE92
MWNGDQLDLDAYLSRVGVTPTDDRTATLRELHRAHLTAIPFENADVLAGTPIALDVPALQDKLVTRRRGGYCYEHALLFAAVLERLGHEVTGLAAKVLLGRTGDIARTHAALWVDRQWLVDVGFGGGGLLEPLPLVEDSFQAQGDWTFRLDRAGEEFTLASYQGDRWVELYAFTRDPRTPADYAVLHHFQSTHPTSPFVGRLVVQRTDDHARHTIVGSELTRATPDGRSEKRSLTADERTAVLRDDFGLTLPTATR